MGRIVIVAYKPKDSKEKELRAFLKKHVPILRKEDLVTDREPVVMRSANGTYIEVFEWKSAQAIEDAHTNKAVLEMWEEFEKCGTYEQLTTLEEAHHMFAEFDAVEV